MSKNLKFKTFEEYAAAHKKFFEDHPEAPLAKDVECLNLIMRREYAEQILRGEKPLEFRQYSEFYIKRLIDPDVSDYIRAHIDDDEVVMFCNDIRQVRKIHFHNYNNSWFLDIECDLNDVFSITKKDINYLQEKFGCHDYDADLEFYEKAKIEKRPWVFYFVCGKVLDTNLNVKSEEKPKEDKFVDICGGEIICEPKFEINDNNKEGLRILQMRVRKGEFNSIVNCEKGEFVKEITPKNIKAFFVTNEDGTVKEINGIGQFKPYDAIEFLNGDNSYTCRINNADVVIFDDEYDIYIPYSELEDEDIDYTDCMISYTLGEKV